MRSDFSIVDIGEIVDYNCLKSLSIILTWLRQCYLDQNWNLLQQKYTPCDCEYLYRETWIKTESCI